jgi:CRISPR-associated protein Cas1
MRDALAYPIPVSERISFLYLDRVSVERDGNSLVADTQNQRIVIPVARTNTLLLGPGSTISHAAVSLAALEGMIIIWVGEFGVRLYANGNPRGDQHALIRQARWHIDPCRRLIAARRIWALMWGQKAPEGRSIEQLRGMEGRKVRELYQAMANQRGISWNGRENNNQDPLNAAISTATSTLYGVAEAAILAVGYSPAIGIIHSGNHRSFVFDIADTIKFKTVVPLAFDIYTEYSSEIERRTRLACRDFFLQDKTISRLVSIMDEIFMDDENADDRY